VKREFSSQLLPGRPTSKSPECFAEARRILHKIKGESGIVGIEEIRELCRQAEFALEELLGNERSEMLLRFKHWLDVALQRVRGEAAGASYEHTVECRTDNEYRPQEQAGTESSSGLKILIVEDDFASRKLLQVYLSELGDCFVAVNGREAVEAVKCALDESMPYDLTCLDIMMPEMDGHKALEAIRRIENERGIAGLDSVKVIMTTALGDSGNVMGAFRTGCEAYIVKPIEKYKLLEETEELGLVNLSRSSGSK
jgi:two-component system chemotaxis response regulator CheY